MSPQVPLIPSRLYLRFDPEDVVGVTTIIFVVISHWPRSLHVAAIRELTNPSVKQQRGQNTVVQVSFQTCFLPSKPR